MSDTCYHERTYYAVESDNYYCVKCNKGMGNAYYDLAKRVAELEQRAIGSMNWATTKPAGPGYYWMNDGEGHEVVHVYFTGGVLIVELFNGNKQIVHGISNKVLWAGPIPRPY